MVIYLPALSPALSATSSLSTGGPRTPDAFPTAEDEAAGALPGLCLDPKDARPDIPANALGLTPPDAKADARDAMSSWIAGATTTGGTKGWWPRLSEAGADAEAGVSSASGTSPASAAAVRSPASAKPSHDHHSYHNPAAPPARYPQPALARSWTAPAEVSLAPEFSAYDWHLPGVPSVEVRFHPDLLPTHAFAAGGATSPVARAESLHPAGPRPLPDAPTQPNMYYHQPVPSTSRLPPASALFTSRPLALAPAPPAPPVKAASTASYSLPSAGVARTPRPSRREEESRRGRQHDLRLLWRSEPSAEQQDDIRQFFEWRMGEALPDVPVEVEGPEGEGREGLAKWSRKVERAGL